MNTDKNSNKQISKPWLYKPGESGNPLGRSVETPEERAIKSEKRKAIKAIVKEALEDHEIALAESMPEITPALIIQAKKGNMQAIREVHEVLGAHKSSKEDAKVAIQINLAEARSEFQ